MHCDCRIAIVEIAEAAAALHLPCQINHTTQPPMQDEDADGDGDGGDHDDDDDDVVTSMS